MNVRFVQIFAIACVAAAAPACSQQHPPIDAEGVSELFAECYGDEVAPISIAVFEYLDADGALLSGDKSVSEFRDEMIAIMTDAYDDAAICLGKVDPQQRDCPALARCFKAFADREL